MLAVVFLHYMDRGLVRQLNTLSELDAFIEDIGKDKIDKVILTDLMCICEDKEKPKELINF
jgi:hypothetical protein